MQNFFFFVHFLHIRILKKGLTSLNIANKFSVLLLNEE